MEKLTTQDIVDAALADWRKLAQRLHARFRAGDPGVGAALVSDAVRAAGEASLGDHLEATGDREGARHLAEAGVVVDDEHGSPHPANSRTPRPAHASGWTLRR